MDPVWNDAESTLTGSYMEPLCFIRLFGFESLSGLNQVPVLVFDTHRVIWYLVRLGVFWLRTNLSNQAKISSLHGKKLRKVKSLRSIYLDNQAVRGNSKASTDTDKGPQCFRSQDTVDRQGSALLKAANPVSGL
jgi:hypothetical protein